MSPEIVDTLMYLALALSIAAAIYVFLTSDHDELP
jgi:hypothetical protein